MAIKTVTIKDVAKFAGVSTATVSRALSKPETVSEATRSTVLHAAKSTGYKINIAARNLRSKQTGAIVVFIPDLANPFFSNILAGIEKAAAEVGKSVFLVNTFGPKSKQDDSIRQYLSKTRADGIIVLDGSLQKGLLQNEAEKGNSPPIVFACEWSSEHDFPSVRADNQLGAALAISHLVDLGHRTIGHLAGPMWNVVSKERMTGFKSALLEHDLNEAVWTFEGDFSIESGVRAARDFVTHERRPTAVFCASDLMAIGFISELAKQGLKVPSDISVVGFDDIDIAERFIPAITTIHQRREQLGISAMRLMMEAIESETSQVRHQPLVLPVELIPRDSTARLA